MAEGSLTSIIRKVVFKVEPYLPQVPKPKKKISLQTKLLWSGIALLIYLVMGQTPLFGATAPDKQGPPPTLKEGRLSQFDLEVQEKCEDI